MYGYLFSYLLYGQSIPCYFDLRMQIDVYNLVNFRQTHLSFLAQALTVGCIAILHSHQEIGIHIRVFILLLSHHYFAPLSFLLLIPHITLFFARLSICVVIHLSNLQE